MRWDCVVCRDLGCEFCPKVSDPLAAARGIVYGLLMSIVAWGVFIGFLAVIFFNVHV